MADIRDGQFKLIEFVMIDATAKTVDCGKALQLTPICVKANIYEDVHSPAVRAIFEFFDAKGIFNNFVFTDKKIVIEFTTNEVNPASSVRYEFYIPSLAQVVPTPNDKGVAIKLECITYEAWKSNTQRNVPLLRKNIECEKMVKAYLNLMESEKDLFAEKTRGLHVFNFTGKTPLQCIDEIRVTHAMSEQFKGHAFYFFENKHGFVFKSMEALIKEGKENVGDKCFSMSTLTNLSVTGAKWRNILAFKNIQNGNQGIARDIGAGDNYVLQVNKKTGTVINFKVDPKTLEFEKLNDGSISSTLKSQNDMSKDEGKITITYVDPGSENAERAEKENHLPFYMAHFLTTISQISIYGDSTITVGDVILCHIPEQTGLTTGNERPMVEDSPMMTGKYIVTKCRHVLTFNEKAEYMQGLEIVKDGILGAPHYDT